ncbi:3-keto-disaccharide hydrolase [Flexithrix dorotheae]|uniref:3-keto-disaccharide hydrolase n=1 Tax=Flexithrix dorotheae TaxID=70993 RepID=UPI00036A12C9|nr:DUF1080 domain-containing protein [Flexithrix dorotheae]
MIGSLKIRFFIIISIYASVSCNNKIQETEVPIKNENQQIATRLFNGKNLDGWLMTTRDDFNGKPEDIFSIENGEIHVFANQENGSRQTFAGLTTKESFSHYNLTLEYKWGEKKFRPRHNFVRDAGIIIHTINPETIWPNGVECQIQEGDTGDLWAIGTKVTSKVSRVIRNFDPHGDSLTLGNREQRFHRFHRGYCWEKPGWNLIELQVRGDYAKFIINGNLVNEAIHMKYWSDETNDWKPLTSGKIMIQAEGAELYYRNILLEKIDGK